jgi:hypothetical protein
MSIRQAGPYTEDSTLDKAWYKSRLEQVGRECGSTPRERIECRLYVKISVYFDGTGNNLYNELKKPIEKQALSNVARLFLAAIDDKSQDSFPLYIPGVGTPFKSTFSDLDEDKGGVLGMAFGKGGEMRLQDALLRFSEVLNIKYGAGAMKHIPVIQVNVFGFSRGAALARAFVLRLLQEQCENGDSSDGVVWKSYFGTRVPLQINFLGLFDTVASVGGPKLHADWAKDLRIPPAVKRCVHLVSGHEVRQAFPLDSIALNGEYPSNSEEVVYPGVHADVGGGYYPNEQGRSAELAKLPLREMYLEALKAGVPLLSLTAMPPKAKEQFQTAELDPLLSAYDCYMAGLDSQGTELIPMVRAHRTPMFQWRSALARSGKNKLLLSGLASQADSAACLAEPAARPQMECSEKRWKYVVPEDATEQGKQLISEQKRLVSDIDRMRAPYSGTGKERRPRERTEYENFILASWDKQETIAPDAADFLANYVHDSVAHFFGWPCALSDPREIFLHRQAIFAQSNGPKTDGTA